MQQYFSSPFKNNSNPNVSHRPLQFSAKKSKLLKWVVTSFSVQLKDPNKMLYSEPPCSNRNLCLHFKYSCSAIPKSWLPKVYSFTGLAFLDTSAKYLIFANTENDWKLSAALKTCKWSHGLCDKLGRQPDPTDARDLCRD